MTVLAGIGFTAPWLLLTLLALPVLWLILRAIPPAPVRRAFPGVTLLLGLRDEDSVSDRTPWWLLALRMAAIAALIIGLAGPVMNPETRAPGSGPLLIVMDASWAGASDWDKRAQAIETELNEAAERPVALLRLTAPEPLQFQPANVWQSRLAGLVPMPWQPVQTDQIVDALGGEEFDTVWISDGADYAGRDDILSAFAARGDVRVIETGAPVLALDPPGFADGAIQLRARRAQAGPVREVRINARGPDPSGQVRTLAQVTARFASADTEAEVALTLPSELRARVTRFQIDGVRSAGAVALTDDRLKRREIALIAGRKNREGLETLSPLHYLEQALVTNADLLNGTLPEVLPANPDVIMLADLASLPEAVEAALTDWVEAGGLLVRFAGPRLAASALGRSAEHPLMPVRLRTGGRSVGGAMSWGDPKSLAAFDRGSPFFGLQIPGDVSVSSQVMAQPDPTLADRVIAALEDGTPLVTRKPLGQGQVVLFHVTANAEWSTLPLSGLFVEMLERLAVSSSAKPPEAEDLDGTLWTPDQILNGFGRLADAGVLAGVAGPDLVDNPVGPDLPPGLYRFESRAMARNVLTADSDLRPASWPAHVPVEGVNISKPVPLGGALLSAALILLALDVLATLALGGRLRAAAACLALLLVTPDPTAAQDRAVQAASDLTLAHVLTGNRQVDDTALAGLSGLADTLYFRTSVEPMPPVGVNLETDDLAFYPLLYWPVTPDQPRPSALAYEKLNAYLRTGGMILFDTRDADVAGFGAASPNGRRLQQLAAPLDIPRLEPVPNDHVLTRTFYLLQDFPGRHAGREVWVEAAPAGAEQVEGMPFRDLNDGVTPVVIGGNDWAAAWATDRDGRAMYPIGRGFAGERQRELAYRFGVNLVMHVLTGNYKSDQVHVPALLDRLGQ
jgi:hypothetical protein